MLAGEPIKSGGGSRDRLRALVADGAAGSRLSLAVTLKGFDARMEIVEAADGQAALRALTGDTPHLAFVNVQLDGMSGAEAIAMARHQGVRPVTFLMTDAVMKKWVDLSVELDAYEFLKKPLDVDHLVAMLANVRRMRERLRLLLVEPSDTARNLVRKVLGTTRFDIEIDETDSGAHAVKLLQLTRYDLALVNEAMPRMDGLETICQGREVATQTHFLLMSTGRGDTLPASLRHFGVAAVLNKPFYARDVEKVLHRLYGLRRPYLLNHFTPEHERKARVGALAVS